MWYVSISRRMFEPRVEMWGDAVRSGIQQALQGPREACRKIFQNEMERITTVVITLGIEWVILLGFLVHATYVGCLER